MQMFTTVLISEPLRVSFAFNLQSSQSSETNVTFFETRTELVRKSQGRQQYERQQQQ